MSNNLTKAALACVCLLPSCLLLADDTPIETMEEHWKQYATRFEEFNEIAVTITTTGTNGSKTASEVMKVLIVRGPEGVFVCEAEQTGREVSKDVEQRYNARTASGFNGEYGFTIVDYKKNNDWLLEDVGSDPVGKGIVVGLDGGGIYLPGVELPLSTLATDAKNANLVDRRDVDGLVELDYEFIKDNIDLPQQGTQKQRSVETAGTKVTLVIDPTKDYLPIRAVTTSKVKDRELTATRKWEYLMVEGKPSGPNEITKDIEGEGMSIAIKESFDLKKVPLEESRFRLTHYGLPEHENVAPSSNALYYALGIGLVGVILVYFSVRKKK